MLALSGRARAAERLRSYDRFLCNSRFTREWIERRLGVDAEVLSPPVDPPASPPAASGRRGSSPSGRFFRNGHEKRQDVLIEAFRALRAAGAPRAGSCTWWARWIRGPRPSAGSSGCAGWPGAPGALPRGGPREELLQLYATSALFWHAAGFGVNPRRHPERLEHFGIATVEAMMHGAVPAGRCRWAGRPSWSRTGTPDATGARSSELVERTRELVAAPARGEALRRAAYAEAQAHGTSRFRARIRAHLLELLEES